jgi:cellulose synthase/poly-beta-1,6-N-acetylglucosamine synthase-like glycosyltransferase
MVVVGMLRPDGPEETPVAPASWPSLSVIIPAHNERERLPGTLESLLAQRYPGEHEFVVVDDRSTDGTGAVLRAFAARDARLRPVRVAQPSRRHAPKVHAVKRGIEASSGEVIVTSDADCRYPEGWLRALASHLHDDVVMVSGYVETELGPGSGPVARFEAADWFSLMLTSRSLLRLGMSFASSANNQAYRRSAFRAAGGFGAAARAPSGDEDLLVQRLGRRSGGRVVFAASPAVRVRTRPMGGLAAFLRQRRRWVSRYQHVVQYHPAFIAGLTVLGLESIALSLALLASPFRPELAPWALGLWAAQTLIHVTGMTVGARQLGRPAFGGLRALPWALLHPFFIAFLVVASSLRPAAWSAGAARYRRRILRRHLRTLRRRWLPR